MTGVFPPPIDSSRLRPKRGWYIAATIILVLGIGGGITTGVLSIMSVADESPDMIKEFRSDEPTTVQLSGDQEWGIYVRGSEGEAEGPDILCDAESSNGDIELSTPSSQFTVNGWRLAYRATVSGDGEYTLDCTGSMQPQRMAVGDSVDGERFAMGMVGIFGGFLVIPGLAVVIGGTIIIVVAVKRNNHKRRLARESFTPPGSTPPPPGPPSPPAAPPPSAGPPPPA